MFFLGIGFFFGVGGLYINGIFFLVEVLKFLEFFSGCGVLVLDNGNEDIVWLFIGNIDINLGIL